MKHIRYSLLMILAALLGFTSCQKDEFEYDDNIDIFNFSNSVDDTIKVQVGGKASFADASRGFEERYWEVSDPSFFINNEDHILFEEIAHAQFMKPGMDSVTITLVYEDTIEIDEFKYEYLIDTTGKVFKRNFMIEVLDSITTSFGVKSVEGNYTENGGKYVVEAGSTVTFEDLSTGQPDTYEWIITGFEDAEFEQKEASVLFKKMGKYDVTLVASRIDPFGQADTLTISEYIEIIPSTLPVNLVSVAENEGGEIRVQFSRELDTPVGEEENITVLDNGVPAVVKSVTLDKMDASILVIQVEENIKNSHTATVSYDATNGNLITTDLMEVESFTDESVVLYAPNILTMNYGFEDGTYAPFTDPFVKKGTGAMGVSSDAHSGAGALIFELGTDAAIETSMADGFFALDQTKKYALEFYAKLGAGSQTSGAVTIRVMPSDGWNDNYKQWIPLSDFNENTWTKKVILTDKMPPASWSAAKLHLNPYSTASGPSNLLIDDFKIYVYEE